MHLISWEASVKKTRGYSGLRVSAHLKCSNWGCKAEGRFETASYLLIDDDLSQVTDKAFEDIVGQRACGECGMLSVIPNADRKKLADQLKLQITPEWVAAELIRQEGLEGVTP